MNKNLLFIAVSLSFLGISQTLPTDVVLNNLTNFHAKMSVIYRGLFCENDTDKDVSPHKSISIPADACLITDITASVYIPGQDTPITATAYSSSGTGYRTFNLVKKANGSFAVER